MKYLIKKFYKDGSKETFWAKEPINAGKAVQVSLEMEDIAWIVIRPRKVNRFY